MYITHTRTRTHAHTHNYSTLLKKQLYKAQTKKRAKKQSKNRAFKKKCAFTRVNLFQHFLVFC